MTHSRSTGRFRSTTSSIAAWGSRRSRQSSGGSGGIGFSAASSASYFSFRSSGFRGRAAVPRHLTPRLIALFVLGGLQGAIGWYMVRSGLVDRVDVSHYRLAVHLGVAVVILGLLLWTALDFGERATDRTEAPRWHRSTPGPPRRCWYSIFLQVLLGALVAGLKAGLSHNTWPLMDGALVPSGLGRHESLVSQCIRERADRAVQSSHGGLRDCSGSCFGMSAHRRAHDDGQRRHPPLGRECLGSA